MPYLQQLDTLLKKSATDKKPERLLIGYRMYLELMKERPFYDEVVGSSMNPNKRRYKHIKIRITQDDYQLALV